MKKPLNYNLTNAAIEALRRAVAKGKPIDWNIIAPSKPQYNPPRTTEQTTKTKK